MNRLAYASLLFWKNGKNRKPLLVQGARQVGKTYLLKAFGQKEYTHCVYCNFEEDPNLAKLFEGEISPAKILESLCAYKGKSIHPENTLIFFDEIQYSQRALTSLKYFCEQAPEYHVVAAGSLLGVSVGRTTSFPVGKVSFLTLYPLSFMEFIDAIEDRPLKMLLGEKKNFEAIPDLVHDKLTGLLKTYLFTGGMPEVIQTWLSTKDFTAVRKVQKDILNAYERDFSKYTTATQAVRVSEIWRSIPSHLARENKKFKYSEVKKNGRAVQFESAIEWLRKAGLVYVTTNVTTSKLPLAGHEDHAVFKVYLVDCGLLGAMTDLPSNVIVLGDTLFAEYNGGFIENFVAGELARNSEGVLHYWASSGIAEVDFLVPYEGSILPIEAKSGLNRNIKSLRVYADRFKPERIYRTSPRNFYHNDDFVNLPLYAVGLFPALR